MILDVVYPVLQSYARNHNTECSAVRALPVDLLCNILEYLPFDDRFSAAQTCHAWMQSSASSNCEVVVNTSSCDARSLRQLAHKLTYFGPAPLVFRDFGIDGSQEEFEPGSIYFPAAKILEQHMWHIRELRLHVIMFYDDDEPIERANGIYAALRLPAPQLQRLIVENGPFMQLDDSWFGGDAPLLECCSFSGVIPAAPAFRNARAVRLQYMEAHPRDLSAILQRLPRLESFFLRHAADRASDAPLVIPASVQRFWTASSALDLKNINHERSAK